MSKIVQGENVILKLYKGTAYMPIGCLTSNSISESQDITEGEPNKCDTTVSKSQGSYTYELSADGVMVDDSDAGYASKAHYEEIRTLWAASRTSGEPLNWALEGGNEDLYGTAFITSLDAEFPTKADATFSISMSGLGEILKTDPKL